MQNCRNCGIEVSGTGYKYCESCPNKWDQQGRKPVVTEKVCVICNVDLPLGERKSDTCGRPQCIKQLDWGRNLWRVYHIRPELFWKIAEDQGWSCAVCKESIFYYLEDGRKPALGIDHDHSCCPGRFSCGECIRGILCHGCNGGMGLFKDNPENLIAAAEYLIAYKKRRENG